MTPVAPLLAGDRLLITRLNYLGDVVMSLSLVDAIRRVEPAVEIDYLTRAAGAELLRGDDRFARVFELGEGARRGAALVAALRRRRYRAVIDLYSNPRSAWLSWLSGAPVRIGGDRRGRRWLYTHRVRVPPGRAVTDVFLAYGAPFGVAPLAPTPRITLASGELAGAEAVLARHGAAAAGMRRIGIHPGGKWSVKRWPAAKFAELVTRLGARDGVTVVAFTGPDEAEATQRVADAAGPALRVLPAMGIREAAAVVARLDAMVACDGGIMHTAVAVGTPTVGIFGSSQPDVWFPYENDGPYRAAFVPIECRPCHRHVCPLGHTNCLNELSSAHVAGLVDEVLSLRQPGRIP